MLHLLLARHGETIWNAQRRFQGHSDVPLSPTGRTQAAALAKSLRPRTIDAVYASDLCRAVETAEILGSGQGVAIAQTPALRELAFGQWEGLTYDKIHRAYPTELQAWLADRLHAAPPGGESLEQLNARLQVFRNQLIQVHSDQTVLVVAHGGPLQVLIATTLGLPPESFWKFRIETGSLSELDLYPTGAILVRLNHVAVASERVSANSAVDHARSSESWAD
jgi:alpha-ribazole phosphatase